MKPTLALSLFWVAFLSAMAQSSAPRFVVETCPATIVSPAAPGMECGRLFVPEDRSSADSPEISLFVAQLPARAASGKRPILVLAGGPGDSASADSAWWLNTTLRDARDIILVDQRGSGFSRPSLNCPEFDARDDADGLDKCRERLLADGIDLSAYRAETVAQDIADLIAALDLAPVNVYARSYGARMALLLAGKQPGAVRALALESVYTGGESALQGAAANTWRAMQLLFAECDADVACGAAYPQLSTQFSRAAAALDAQPRAVDGILPGAALLLDGQSFAVLLRDMLADAHRLPYIPALIAAVAENDYDSLGLVASQLPAPRSRETDTFSEGLYYSALCADETALTSAGQINAEAKSLPREVLPLSDFALGLLSDCGSWRDTANGGVHLEPPPIDIPTLYLAGAYDPIAPGPGALADRTPVWRLVFPHLGHGVLEYEPCAEAAVVAFLANPTEMPSDACRTQLRPPAFYVREDE